MLFGPIDVIQATPVKLRQVVSCVYCFVMLCIITCLYYVFSKLMFFLFFIGNFDIFYCRFYLFCITILSKLHQHPISSGLTLSVKQLQPVMAQTTVDELIL